MGCNGRGGGTSTYYTAAGTWHDAPCGVTPVTTRSTGVTDCFFFSVGSLTLTSWFPLSPSLAEPFESCYRSVVMGGILDELAIVGLTYNGCVAVHGLIL